MAVVAHLLGQPAFGHPCASRLDACRAANRCV